MDKITLETYEDVKALTDRMEGGFKWLVQMIPTVGYGACQGWSGDDAEQICKELRHLHHEAVAFRKWHERA